MPYADEIPPMGNLMAVPAELNALSYKVIGVGIEVHRRLGPGMPEQAYQGAMEVELALQGIPFERLEGGGHRLQGGDRREGKD